MKSFNVLVLVIAVINLDLSHANPNLCWNCLDNTTCVEPNVKTLPVVSNCNTWSESEVVCLTVTGQTDGGKMTYRNCAPKIYNEVAICTFLNDDTVAFFIGTSVTNLSCNTCNTNFCNGPALLTSGASVNLGIIYVPLMCLSLKMFL